MKTEEWSPSSDVDLEPNADLACREQRRSVAVTAGPGAGKTELLAQRADYLLSTNACPYPKRILAISFKVDAASNLLARVRERVSSDLVGRLDSYTFHAFAYRLIQRFRPVLTGTNQLDADFSVGENRIPRIQITYKDFIPLAIEILEHSPSVLAALRATYSHVFLDEFQDCTTEQYALIQTAFLGTDVRLTAVGDTKQRIMGWAGALEGIFEKLAEDFDVLPLNLYQNRRSAPRLRRMQNRMIAVMEPTAAVPEASLSGESGRIDVLGLPDENEEAERITAWVQGLIKAGTPESEIAVLFRQQPGKCGVPLFRALEAAGIGYRNEESLQDLAAQPLTKLLLAYLQILVGARGPAAYVRLNRSSLFSVHGETDLIRLRTAWEQYVNLRRAGVQTKILSLRDRMVLEKLTREFLDFFGASAIAALHPEYESVKRVNELVTQLIDRVLELLEDGSPATEALERFAEERGVRIMTIHKSKGLEFAAVAVPAVEHEMFWGDADAARAQFFVAISRAKEHLLLTHVDSRSRPDRVTYWSAHRNAYQEFLAYAADD